MLRNGVRSCIEPLTELHCKEDAKMSASVLAMKPVGFNLNITVILLLICDGVVLRQCGAGLL